MKDFKNPIGLAGALLLCLALMFACKKTGDLVPDEEPEPQVQSEPPPVSGTITADTVSNHLYFFNAQKIQGNAPGGPAGSSLKISVKDTLYLTDKISAPVKFFHEDTTKDVAGVFAQVFIGSTGATYYYDIPEIGDMANSDTVSVILIGIDPETLTDPGGVPPAGTPSEPITIKIVPYDENRQPIGEDVIPVNTSKPKLDPGQNGGNCGLVLPDGESWDWVLTVTNDLHPTKPGEFAFYNEPYKVFGAGGQFIKGCCNNGISSYDIICAGDTAAQRSLHFATSYSIWHESFVFFDNGKFFRQSIENTPIPAPDESDFCGNGEGVVTPNLNHVTYNGNWSIRKITLPPDLRRVYDDSLSLSLQGTSSSGGGFGNPGGVIHQLDCRIGSLVLMRGSNEGGSSQTYFFYIRTGPDEDREWHPFG